MRNNRSLSDACIDGMQVQGGERGGTNVRCSRLQCCSWQNEGVLRQLGNIHADTMAFLITGTDNVCNHEELSASI